MGVHQTDSLREFKYGIIDQLTVQMMKEPKSFEPIKILINEIFDIVVNLYQKFPEWRFPIINLMERCHAKLK